MMYHQPMCRPLLLNRPVKTWPAGRWCAGTNTRTATMTSTPRMCHQTLMSFSLATSRMPNWLSVPCSSRTSAKITIVSQCASPRPNWRFRNALMKKAAPKSIPAVTATWPMKLNQPVNQDQAGEQRHAPDAEPAPDDDRRTAEVHAEVEQSQAARQDRDDGERDGEVRESRHPPHEFLGIAQPVQGFLIAEGPPVSCFSIDRHNMLLGAPAWSAGSGDGEV